MNRIFIIIMLIFVFFISPECFALTMPAESDEELETESELSQDKIEENISEIIEEYREKSKQIVNKDYEGIKFGNILPAAVFVPLLREINSKFVMTLKYTDILHTKEYIRLVANTDWNSDDYEYFVGCRDSLFNEMKQALMKKVLTYYGYNWLFPLI